MIFYLLSLILSLTIWIYIIYSEGELKYGDVLILICCIIIPRITLIITLLSIIITVIIYFNNDKYVDFKRKINKTLWKK
jgi:hypothetical protein